MQQYKTIEVLQTNLNIFLMFFNNLLNIISSIVYNFYRLFQKINQILQDLSIQFDYYLILDIVILFTLQCFDFLLHLYYQILLYCVRNLIVLICGNINKNLIHLLIGLFCLQFLLHQFLLLISYYFYTFIGRNRCFRH